MFSDEDSNINVQGRNPGNQMSVGPFSGASQFQPMSQQTRT